MVRGALVARAGLTRLTICYSRAIHWAQALTSAGLIFLAAHWETVKYRESSYHQVVPFSKASSYRYNRYVAYAIQYLAPQSSTGQISIIGHSQGAGINPQWALDFWPSTRPLVSDYISLAGTFHGSGEGVIACTQQDLTQDGCLVSYIQQTTGSYYLQAQNTRGGAALVTTTSIYTHYDDIIQPENGPNPTSVLPGAANFALQDLDICGPAHVADHFMMVVDPAAYGLALDALSNPGPADASRFDPTYCTYFKSDELLNLTNVPAYVEAIVNDQVANGPRAFVEPMLMAYVCAEGQSTYC